MALLPYSSDLWLINVCCKINSGKSESNAKEKLIKEHGLLAKKNYKENTLNVGAGHVLDLKKKKYRACKPFHSCVL